MHATTEQLLTLRDQQPEATDVVEHVDGCLVCQEKLQRLTVVRQGLNALAELPTSSQPTSNEFEFENSWRIISERVEKQKLTQKNTLLHKRHWLSGLSIAASLVLTVVLANKFVWYQTPGNDSPRLSTDQAPVLVQSVVGDNSLERDNSLEQVLVQRNVNLEQALRELPQPRHVVRGSTAATIANLEDQIALVDYGLSYAEQVGISETGSISLLQNRADLLDTLYKVRYTQAVASLAY